MQTKTFLIKTFLLRCILIIFSSCFFWQLAFAQINSSPKIQNNSALPAAQSSVHSNPPPAPAQLTVILDWFVNPDHAPLFVAQQQGFFQREGLTVKFIAPADPADPPKLVASGHADIAIDYQPNLLMEMANGLPVTQIGTLIATPLNTLAALGNGSIHQLQDLKGKRIGYSTDSTDSGILSAMLKQVGLTLNQVQLINVHYDLTQALLSHQVDAVIGVVRNFELIQIKLAGKTTVAFFPEDYGMPPYDELVFIANKNRVNDPLFSRFLQAVELGTQYLVNHPEESWQIFAKNHPELNNELNHQAWFATLPRFALRPGATDINRCRNLANYLNMNVDKKITPQLCEPKN